MSLNDDKKKKKKNTHYSQKMNKNYRAYKWLENKTNELYKIFRSAFKR